MVAAGENPTYRHVLHISVDGLRPGDVEELLAANELPNFRRLQQESAWTHNARTDTTYVYTLPNHTSMMTGRPTDDVPPFNNGHQYRYNTDPEDDPLPNDNLHENARLLSLGRTTYVASAFDVAHDAGLRTALYTGKDKFIVFDDSWDADDGAPDLTGVDNGRDKIDVYRNSDDRQNGITNTTTLVNDLAAQMRSATPFNYAFLHIEDPDAAGHNTDNGGWGSPLYRQAIRDTDAWLGTLLETIDTTPGLRETTAVILTADHGGGGASDYQHGNPGAPQDFTIPFYVRAPGVTAGQDLYALNLASREAPSPLLNPPYALVDQPIRNGDSGNLALDLLGLGPIPGSSINADQSLVVPEPATLTAVAVVGLLLRRRGSGGDTRTTATM